MLNFRLGAAVMGWSPGWWRCSVLLHRLKKAWAGWGISDLSAGSLRVVQQSWMVWAVGVSILAQVNDHLLQERCKRRYPEWQFTFKKFKAIKHILFNKSLLLHSEWFTAGFKMYCFGCAYTFWTLNKNQKTLKQTHKYSEYFAFWRMCNVVITSHLQEDIYTM